MMHRRTFLSGAALLLPPLTARAASGGLHPQLEQLVDGMLPTVKHFQSRSMYSPHAATIDREGHLSAKALTSDGSKQFTVAQTIDYFTVNFRKLAQSGQIVASGIFYHSRGVDTSSGKVVLPPASTIEECVALVALLEHASGQSLYLLLPYSNASGAVQYATGRLIQKPASVFVPEQPSGPASNPR